MIFESPSPAIDIPAVSLTDYVLAKAKALGDKPALIDGPSGRTLSYSQLAGAVDRVAESLANKGFRKGDVFAIFSPNLPEYGVIFLAVAKLGGVNTTINPLYTAGELKNQLQDSGAIYLITVPPFLEKAREAAQNTTVKELYVFGEVDGATAFSTLLNAPGNPPQVAIDSVNDLVVLPYSSGTTGLPKGVMLTHRNLVANLEQIVGMQGFEGFGEDSTVVGILPFFHIYGMVVILCHGVASGSTVVTLPKFDMEDFLGTLQKYKVTIAPLVPPIVLGLAKHPLVDNFDLSALSLVFSGAAPLGESLEAEAGQRLNCPVVQGYGMTEASPVTHLSAYGSGANAPGSIGQVVPNTQVKLVDTADGRELGANEEGELLIRGPQIMKGYLKRPEATAESIDPGGWYRSGDIGYADGEGRFFIVDRVKELIKYKAMQVAPAELEALLLTHPSISDAAVIPFPDEEAGEIPMAYVVSQSAMAHQEVLDFVHDKVAPHKRIRKVEFIEQIPKSASGKILRRLLVEKVRAEIG